MYKLNAISSTANILLSPIEYLKGVGPLKAELLKKELAIFTFKDLLEFYPFRHVDKTRVDKIGSLHGGADYAQVAGKLTHVEVLGDKRAKRLVAYVQDDTGEIELIWFQGISWVEKLLTVGHHYLVFGKLGFFNNKVQINHPDLELYTAEKAGGQKFLEPIYSSTEKLKARGLTAKAFAKLTYHLFQLLTPNDLPENLPESVLKQYRFISRWEAFCSIHFPASEEMYTHALRRLKFEEFFVAQLRLGLLRSTRHRFSKGWEFNKVGDLFNTFYNTYLPFELTNAQKRVLKEIRKDFGSGKQMNRLLQGDVGSGKTIVALLSMLIAADNTNADQEGQGFQSVLMAPTEILAQQHFITI